VGSLEAPSLALLDHHLRKLSLGLHLEVVACLMESKVQGQMGPAAVQGKAMASWLEAGPE